MRSNRVKEPIFMPAKKLSKEHDVTAIEREFVSLPSPTVGRNGAGYMPTQGLYYHASGSKPDAARDHMADIVAAWLEARGV